MVLRRLAADEWVNTVGDLLGLTRDQQAALGRDLPGEAVGEIGFAVAGLVGVADVQRFAEKAREAAALRPGELVPCTAGSAEDQCVRGFLAGFLPRAFRRPVTPEETAELVMLFSELRSGGLSFPDAARELVATVLQAPQFLYHGDLAGGRTGLVKLSPQTLANRLSYALWRTMPDATLATAAASGRLQSDADVEREARRLLADERSRRGVLRFFDELLGYGEVESAPKAAQSFTPALRARLLDEAHALISAWFTREARWGELLTSGHAMLDVQLAAHYGAATLSPQARSGVLTLAAVQASHAGADEPSPMKRGALVRQRLLCQPLPPMPAVVPRLPDPVAGRTVRDRLEAHTSDPACQGCHDLIDPIGFAFSGFDAIGRPRALEEGRPVDTRGHVSGLDGGKRAFTDVAGLTALLAESPQVRACAVTNWFRYLFARTESAADAPSIAAVTRLFSERQHDVRELIVALVTSDSFRHGGQP